VIVDKPWGKVVTYALNQPSSVRVITVEPGQETSVHYHQMRDEMWVVLDPGLSVQIGNRQVEASSGEEFMVSAETTHRIANPGTTRGRVLEIAYGYTTEDDTLRLQDEGAAGTQLQVRGQNLAPDAADNQMLFAPVELKGFCGRKALGNEGRNRQPLRLLAPFLHIAAHAVIATDKALPLQLLEKDDGGTLLATGQIGVLGQSR
jgi:mannose-1-phosphate guanylyltransferase/mannose-6-phosphate isomerase